MALSNDCNGVKSRGLKKFEVKKRAPKALDLGTSTNVGMSRVLWESGEEMPVRPNSEKKGI